MNGWSSPIGGFQMSVIAVLTRCDLNEKLLTLSVALFGHKGIKQAGGHNGTLCTMILTIRLSFNDATTKTAQISYSINPALGRNLLHLNDVSIYDFVPHQVSLTPSVWQSPYTHLFQFPHQFLSRHFDKCPCFCKSTLGTRYIQAGALFAFYIDSIRVPLTSSVNIQSMIVLV